jgi:hypothetical protein|tara:strand:+ start:5168 stop:6064 length:897 start_codon:yes stop_codon:yes gene_type:complete
MKKLSISQAKRITASIALVSSCVFFFNVGHVTAATDLPANADLPQNGNIVGRWYLDEASGTRADYSGNGFTLTDNNTVLAATGISENNASADNAAHFEDSNSESLSRVDEAELSITGDLSHAFWVKFESFPTGGNQMYFASKYDATNTRSWYVRYEEDNGTNYLTFFCSSAGVGGTFGTRVAHTLSSLATWYHIVVAYDASAGTADWYVGGSSVGQATGLQNSIADSNAAFYLGAFGWGPGRFLDGTMQDHVLWDTKLTSADALSDYQAYTVASAGAATTPAGRGIIIIFHMDTNRYV